MKKNLDCREVFISWLKKLLLMSKLSVLLILFAFASVSANVYSQNSKLTLKMHNSRIADVFDAIEKQTNYYFFYNRDNFDDDKIVKVDIQNKKVEDVLDELFKDEPVTYEIVDRNILIKVNDGFNFTSSQQERTIKGTVKDTDGETLPGVSIIVKGTTTGIISDFEGNFQLTVPGNAETLVFSFVGMKTQEIALAGQSVFNIVMVEDAVGVDEVVVVGYGTSTKANLTGAVSSVNVAELETRSVANTATILQGTMSGVQVSNFNTQPGEDNPEIRIRGIGTFNSGQEPLVIVDGIQSSLSQIPVQDIESISVLKDAASASIYGVRAANGVILVTTKRGKKGAPVVDFRSKVSFQQSTENPDFLPSYEWAEIQNMWAIAEGSNAKFTDDQIQKMRDGSDPDHWANTDWWDVMFRTALMQTHYVSVRGGGENTRYMVSGEFMDQEGVLIGTDAKRYSFRANLDSELSKKFKIGVNLSGFKREYNEGAIDPTVSTGDNSLIYRIRRFSAPTVPVYYTNGEYGFVDGEYGNNTGLFRNALFLTNTGTNNVQIHRIETKAFADWEIIDGLHFKNSASYIYRTNNRTKYIPRYTQTSPEGEIVNININNNLTERYSHYHKSEIESFLTYKKNFGDHGFSTLLGHTSFMEREDWSQGYIEGFANDNLEVLDAGVSNPQVGGSAYEISLESYFGRINYNYKDKYLLEFNLRRDGTSRLRDELRWGTFPSASAGWVASNESFFPQDGAISFLKLRGSWGTLGNQQIGGAYPYVQNFSTGNDYIVNGNIVGGVAITDLANADLKWETTTVTDIGIDLNLFDNKLQFVADWFEKVTDDILMRLPISPLVGANNPPFQNVAEVKNTGWEAQLNYRGNVGNFNYYFNGNIAHVKNEIVDIAGRENWISGRSINIVGEPIGAYYTIIADGYYQSQEEIDEYGVTQWGTLAPGDIRYRDISGPDGVPDGQITYEYDRQIVGKRFPDYQYAFGMGGSYKNVDFNLFFQGISGLDRWNWVNTETTGNFTASIKDYWREDNRDASFPRFGNANNNMQFSTYWMKDASYLRLKNIEVGYTLPQSLLNKTFIKNVRVYAQGTNLITWTDFKEFDPEKVSGDERARVYPGVKGYTFGVNVKF